MSEFELGDALVIVHPRLTQTLEQSIAEILAPALRQAAARSSQLVGCAPSLCDLSGADWRQLLHDLPSGEAPIRELLSARPGPVLHFGTAPVAIALELGRRLGPTHRVLAYYDGLRVPRR
jgi:hypothetical protein